MGVPGGSFSINIGGEDVVNFNTGEHTVFGYHGPGVSQGASATVSAYIGLVWNLPKNSDYLGDFESVNATAAAGHGGSFTYFWAPGDEPIAGAFTSGNTKGFAVGYAPGAGASVSYNQTEYFIFESYLPVPPEEQQNLDCAQGDC